MTLRVAVELFPADDVEEESLAATELASVGGAVGPPSHEPATEPNNLENVDAGDCALWPPDAGSACDATWATGTLEEAAGAAMRCEG